MQQNPQMLGHVLNTRVEAIARNVQNGFKGKSLFEEPLLPRSCILNRIGDRFLGFPIGQDVKIWVETAPKRAQNQGVRRLEVPLWREIPCEEHITKETGQLVIGYGDLSAQPGAGYTRHPQLAKYGVLAVAITDNVVFFGDMQENGFISSAASRIGEYFTVNSASQLNDFGEQYNHPGPSPVLEAQLMKAYRMLKLEMHIANPRAPGSETNAIFAGDLWVVLGVDAQGISFVRYDANQGFMGSEIQPILGSNGSETGYRLRKWQAEWAEALSNIQGTMFPGMPGGLKTEIICATLVGNI
jgi:hypothetical protein